mmetsp:Transcript_83020/g.248722  ORF Transcript_83020/g.248722 Transcript_83020/m.248722 type:complete len:675 (+) Transcript_83020:94-2118(+)
MTYGFGVFFLCIAIGPVTCYGAWIALPVATGSLEFEQAWLLMSMQYQNWWGRLLVFAANVAALDFHFDWPDWLNIDALLDFIDDPLGTLEEVFEGLLNMLFFLQIDLTELLDGARELLRFNSVLAAMKPLAAGLLKAWFVVSFTVKQWLGDNNQRPEGFSLVLFGACVPSKDEIEKATMLKNARAQGSLSVAELKRKYQYSAADMKMAGYAAEELLWGETMPALTAEVLDPIFSVTELREANFTYKELCDAKLPARDLRAFLESATACRKAASVMKNAGYAVTEMRLAFTVEELSAVRFDAGEMRQAGFSAAELKPFYDARQLCDARFTAEDMMAAGFQAESLVDAFAAGELKQVGFTAEQLRKAGLSADKLKAVFEVQILRNGGFELNELRAAGYTASELIRIGVRARDLRNAGYGATDLKGAKLSCRQLKDAGFSSKALIEACFTAQLLADAGFNALELKKGGAPVAEISEIRDGVRSRFTPFELKDAGFGAKELKVDAKLLPLQLKDAGFSDEELVQAGLSAKELKDAGCTAEALRFAELPSKFSAREMIGANFKSAKELKLMGYRAADLRSAFSALELKRAGWNVRDLKSVGFGAASLVAAKFTAKQLRDAGFQEAELIQGGLTATESKSWLPRPRTLIGSVIHQTVADIEGVGKNKPAEISSLGGRPLI